MIDETPTTFRVEHAKLIGILHMPARTPHTGFVIVVGGPQYRVGSHRQFLLLARHLAAQGIAVLRFDCRGMGDSAGEFPGFEHIAPDVAGAVDALLANVPSLQHVILWGLCDATLAICQCACQDARISGVVLLNPWVRTEASHARAQLRHYYLQRLTDREFLVKILSGKFNPLASLRSLGRDLRRALTPGSRGDRVSVPSSGGENPLAQMMATSLARFRGRVLLILSGNDLTAKEFEDAARASEVWRRLYTDERLTLRHLEPADHTFSRRSWRDQVADWTSEWISNGDDSTGQRPTGT